MAVETTDEPFTREYSVESFGTDYLFRVRIRLGFKVSQSIPAYLHQIMHDLEKTGELPNQQSIYPKLDADPGIGTIRYVGGCGCFFGRSGGQSKTSAVLHGAHPVQ